MARWLLTGFIFSLLSCAKSYQPNVANYQIADSTSDPDYNNLYFWAAHPWKKDPADSIPKDLAGEKRDSIADVFFIHPTTYTGTRKGWNASVTDAELNAKTDYSSILYQASAFNQQSRVFAPRYRQGHYSAFFIPEEESKLIFNTAYADVKTAFQAYLKHFYKGRPIIIAGHSQGALLAERLLSEFFDGKPLGQNLVAAYIIGWPIPRDAFKSLPVCKTPEQTGCFCGWRTFRKGYIPEYITKERTTSYVTNPLSWTTDDKYVSSLQNKGSVLRKFNELVPHTTDAQIHDGVLWVNKPKFKGSVFFSTSNYHIADINLFYANLRQNVAQRITSFKKY